MTSRPVSTAEDLTVLYRRRAFTTLILVAHRPQVLAAARRRSLDLVVRERARGGGERADDPGRASRTLALCRELTGWRKLPRSLRRGIERHGDETMRLALHRAWLQDPDRDSLGRRAAALATRRSHPPASDEGSGR